MADHVLITGGAGFIGSHLADELLAHGYRVRVLDNLCTQVHGDERQPPRHLADEAELVIGDVRQPGILRRALRGVDGVFHLAAADGVGQSTYRIADYTSINTLGTATLLEALVDRRPRKLVVASSGCVYGEGLYRAADGSLRGGVRRSREQLLDGDWEPRDEEGQWLSPVPTPEWKAPDLVSVHALTKHDQERLCLMMGEAYGFPAVALRLFNTYGPRQPLWNPGAGVLAVLAASLLGGQQPLLFEDGEQRRDFVHVRDVARACRLAYESSAADFGVLNVGSGTAVSMRELAERTAVALGCPDRGPEVSGRYRVGDIRHCFADVSRARETIGFTAEVTLEEGLRELAAWLPKQTAVDRVGEARAELASRGLTL